MFFVDLLLVRVFKRAKSELSIQMNKPSLHNEHPDKVVMVLAVTNLTMSYRRSLNKKIVKFQ